MTTNLLNHQPIAPQDYLVLLWVTSSYVKPPLLLTGWAWTAVVKMQIYEHKLSSYYKDERMIMQIPSMLHFKQYLLFTTIESEL